jgi:hypothetical protein
MIDVAARSWLFISCLVKGNRSSELNSRKLRISTVTVTTTAPPALIKASREEPQTFLDVSGHVLAARVVVAKMQDNGHLVVLKVVRQAHSGSPHLALAGIAPTTEEWHVELVANALDHTD